MAAVFTNKDHLIDRLTELAISGQWVFRGYNTQEQLLPNVIRRNVSDVEDTLLFEFERYGAQYINASNPVDFMSYAQHFGLSTRLLDFTYNPFVALYFALFSPKSNGNYRNPEDKDYYYIRYASTNNNIMIHHIPYFNDGPLFEINSMAQRSMALIETVEAMFSGQNISSFLFDSPEKMVSAFFKSIAMHTDINDMDAFVSDNKEKVSNGAILFIDPNQSNQRLVMQQGLFMFPYTLDEKKHLQVIESNTSLIKIKKDLRDELLAYLDTIGINAFRIMPDLPSVCEAVERKVKDSRNAKSTLFKKK
jgi:hypothetical protein